MFYRMLHRLPVLAKPPYRVRIKQQLVMLVLFVALISLIILAVITGVYFTYNYKELRADRLYVAAQLKSSQMDQSLDYFFYQCYWVSEQQDFGDSLVRKKAGNNTAANWVDSTVILDKFLSSSNTFTNAVLYDTTFTSMLFVSNNGTGDQVHDSVMEKLLPLSGTEPLPASLNTVGMLTNPVLNSSNYLMSMSLPIFSSASILLTNNKLTGYLTIVMTADSIRSVFNDSSSLGKSEVSFVSAAYKNGNITGYTFIFPPHGYVISVDTVFPISNQSFLEDVLTTQKPAGSIKKTKFFYDTTVALGFSRCSFSLTNWAAVVTQPQNVFLAPTTKLNLIIILTVVIIAILLTILTLCLAGWAAQPIVRLKQATELIAAGRGLRSGNYSTLELNSQNGSSVHTSQVDIVDNIQSGNGSRRNTIQNHEKKIDGDSIVSSAFKRFGFFKFNKKRSPTNNDTTIKYNIHEVENKTEPDNDLDKEVSENSHESTPHKEFLDKNDILEASARRTISKDMNNFPSLISQHINNNNNHNNKYTNNDTTHSNSGNSLWHHRNKSQPHTIDLIYKSDARCDSPMDSKFNRYSGEYSMSNSNPYSDRRPDLPHTTTNLINARIPVYRRIFIDELSELTDTFNTMTDELDRYYSLLEDRVRARTKELEQAKLQAEAANEAKTVFIANISHELRTPLNGILGMTAIAMAEKDPDQIQNSLKLIFRSGELLLHILTELLTFSKNVLKRTNLEEREFLIQDIALQINSIFGKLAKDQHVKLTIDIKPNDVRKKVLWGDSNRLIQIVMNLVSNALKFTPVDGIVNVRITMLGKYDFEKSAAVNHKVVFTKPLEEKKQSTRDMNNPFKDGTDFHHKDVGVSENKDGYFNHVVSTTNDNTAAADQNEDEINDVTSDDFDDTQLQSISSSSASSYDDALFLSQFKKNDNNGESGEFDDFNAKFIDEEDRETWVISIEVEDSGPGIDPKLQQSVFEPFVQGDQTLSRQYGGTGLGLSICRQLALMMKGTMQLESKVGQGSKFTFTVPLKQTRELLLDETQIKFDDEFNSMSKTRRKIRFKEANKVVPKKRLSASSGIHDDSMSKETKDNRPNILKAASDHSVKTSNVNVTRPFLQSTGTATSSHRIPVVKDFSNGVKKSGSINKTTPVGTNGTSSAPVNKDDNFSKYKILIAEDNNVNQEVIKRMLYLQGYKNIDLACDGQEAIDKVKEIMDENDEDHEHYSIIFMDVQMPRVDGLEATKVIRKELNYKHNIVALTAFADDSNIKECLEAGMNGFLSKPIKRPMLKKILEEYMLKEEEKE